MCLVVGFNINSYHPVCKVVNDHCIDHCILYGIDKLYVVKSMLLIESSYNVNSTIYSLTVETMCVNSIQITSV